MKVILTSNDLRILAAVAAARLAIRSEGVHKKPGLSRVFREGQRSRQGLLPVGKGHAAWGLSAVFAAGAAAGLAGAGAAGAAGAFLAAGFLAAGFLAAFLAAVFFAAGFAAFFAAGFAAFFAGAFFAAVFLTAAFFAGAFLAAVFLTAAFFAGAFFAAVFFTAAFLAGAFFAGAFFAAVFFAVAISFLLDQVKKSTALHGKKTAVKQLFIARGLPRMSAPVR